MASKPPQTARERQKERELMEARQAGTVAPALDKERGGEMINPHNPEFLTKKPWYLGDDAAEPRLFVDGGWARFWREAIAAR